MEFYLSKKNFLKIINLKKNINIKIKFITITYNNFKLNKKIINYFLKKKKKILPHIICKNNIKNFNYLINMYYINNIKNLMIIKGDEKISNFYYCYNFLNIIKNNYKNLFKIYLGLYAEFHQNNLNNIFDFKNNIIKKNIFLKSIFISQYIYDFNSYCYFYDDLSKIKKNIKIIPGIMPINNLKKVISFSNICKSNLPVWLVKKLSNNFFKKKNFNKINIEINCNIIYKMNKFKINFIHFYTMNNTKLINNIFSFLINNFNF
ncbi:methylenetetrahydrofolate reductase [Candidatus Nasuia deltocephalinicola]|uniref:methylenetetrahydrofolate reductase n=1 Tax=Candidatus Nasuia deltocephalincola TaxID=1160784 RepID=UPI00216AB99B|nr:methylenetetrahydrofolate reductase [Candidatus Nasuia deltocephalinicola]